VILLPGLLPPCAVVDTTIHDAALYVEQPYCLDTSGLLNGITIVDAKPYTGPALQEALRPLVTVSRADPHNGEYYLLSNVNNENKFGFFESWKGLPALVQHISSSGVRSVFGDPYTTSLFASETLVGPFVKNSLCEGVSEPIMLSFVIPVDQPLHAVWGNISDWTNVAWRFNITHIEYNPTYPSYHTLTLFNGDQIDEIRNSEIFVGAGSQLSFTTTYLYSSTPAGLFRNFKTTITAQPTNSNSTIITYQSEFSPALSSDNLAGRLAARRFVTSVFERYEIPHLEAYFQ
jgi:quinol monooxygenase YgiN